MIKPDPISFGLDARPEENRLPSPRSVSERAVLEEMRRLEKLFPDGELIGKRFLDIGCGSGLSMLAAHHLGAASVAGVDLDPASVATAQELLKRSVPEGQWNIQQKSVFDLIPEEMGYFDVVYSWDVLHHTGNMATGITCAAGLVEPQGQLLIALYRKTPLCDFWSWEKPIYTQGSEPVRKLIRAIYKTAYVIGLFATGRNPLRYIEDYKRQHGVDWSQEIHDWLGRYPYESVSPNQIIASLALHGFEIERMFEHKAAAGGLFGSHCDEFVARRVR